MQQQNQRPQFRGSLRNYFQLNIVPRDKTLHLITFQHCFELENSMKKQLRPRRVCPSGQIGIQQLNTNQSYDNRGAICTQIGGATGESSNSIIDQDQNRDRYVENDHKVPENQIRFLRAGVRRKRKALSKTILKTEALNPAQSLTSIGLCNQSNQLCVDSLRPAEKQNLIKSNLDCKPGTNLSSSTLVSTEIGLIESQAENSRIYQDGQNFQNSTKSCSKSTNSEFISRKPSDQLTFSTQYPDRQSCGEIPKILVKRKSHRLPEFSQSHNSALECENMKYQPRNDQFLARQAPNYIFPKCFSETLNLALEIIEFHKEQNAWKVSEINSFMKILMY
ncbi:hypothetical protein FGO68_gene16210 [Halteria grandinella]|uniref:Uncharacterized protein n=1 Tax=Halteria grandinella TaxID=5974 RepID=A0A8J8NDP5_HALGN|nr:hypothetical protein FGO68_gene16210 [Halteria grandinella]